MSDLVGRRVKWMRLGVGGSGEGADPRWLMRWRLTQSAEGRASVLSPEAKCLHIDRTDRERAHDGADGGRGRRLTFDQNPASNSESEGWRVLTRHGTRSSPFPRR